MFSRGSGSTSGTTARCAASNGAVNVSATSSSRSSSHTGVESTASSAITPTTTARARSQPSSTTLRGIRSASVPSSAEPKTAGTKLDDEGEHGQEGAVGARQHQRREGDPGDVVAELAGDLGDDQPAELAVPEHVAHRGSPGRHRRAGSGRHRAPAARPLSVRRAHR